MRVVLAGTKPPQSLSALIETTCTDKNLPEVMPSEFNEAVYITPHNQPVFHYAHQCAREFAKRHDRQLMWCPPRDAPDSWFTSGYTKEELAQKQLNWLFTTRAKQMASSVSVLCATISL